MSPPTIRRLALIAAIAALLPGALPTNPAHGSTDSRSTLPIALRDALAAGAPVAAPAHDVQHGMGLRLVPHRVARRASTVAASGLPASADLSQYNPAVGNQEQVNSCGSWSTGYYLRGWYANRDGYYPTGPDSNGGFAPMFLYSQINGGSDDGSSLEDNMSTMVSQGIDTRADYTQGDYNWSSQPTTAEKQHASAYTITGYSANYDQSALSLGDWIKTQIAGGTPVVIAMPVYNNFYDANSTNYQIDGDGNGQSLGGHAVFADKYDSYGVWVENQWGTSWGLNGWAELSWSFINTYGEEAVSATVSAEGENPTATPISTAAARATATAAARQTATARATATAVARQTATAAAQQTAAARGTATAVARQTATAAAQQTAAARGTATAVAHETATAAAQQTAAARQVATAAAAETAAARRVATVIAKQTATAVAQQTADARSTTTAVARQTATAAAQQTAEARATSTALAQQTATARSEATVVARQTASANEMATALAAQTAAADQMATAVAAQTAAAG